MENTEPKKLGGGLLTVTIIDLVISILGVFGTIATLLVKNSNNELFKSNAAIATINPTQLKIDLIIMIFVIIGLILILLKQAIGVYIYFVATIINIVYGIILSGFKPLTLVSFVLPILMGIFIFLKKDVFWNKNTIE